MSRNVVEFALPFELWQSVVKIAVTSVWPNYVFFPPQEDFGNVQGFEKSTPIFASVVDSVRHESVCANDYDQFMTLNVPYQRVRHLRINKDIQNTDAVFEQVSRYTQLASISFCSCDPSSTIKKLEFLPAAAQLQRLDFRTSSTFLPWRTMTLDFPNLVELRLGATYAFREDYLPRRAFLAPNLFSNEKDFAANLVSKLSELRNLRLLSIHMATDDQTLFLNHLRVHFGDLEHLQPSEGYERHISDCPMCTSTYNHTDVIRREDSATRILAEGLPRLERVLWTNAWRREWVDDKGQRGTQISRGDDRISLIRDDGETSDQSDK